MFTIYLLSNCGVCFGAEPASLCSSLSLSLFLRNLSSSSSLVLFLFPYKSLCSRSEIIKSHFDLCFSSCSFISSRSDHNFIPVYWPKFTEKAETKRNRLNLKNRSRFSEPYGSHGSLLFSHWAVLEAKKTTKLRGSRFFRSDCTVRSGFQNLTYEMTIISRMCSNKYKLIWFGVFISFIFKNAVNTHLNSRMEFIWKKCQE